MERMTITKGLDQLKLLASRITSKIDNTQFFAPLQNGKKINERMSTEEFSKVVKETKQSIDDLITRRENIKKAIVQSNALTKLTIAGVEMTVAEAIEYKSSILFKKALLEKLERQLKVVESTVNNGNNESTKKANDAVIAALGKDSTKYNKEQFDDLFNQIYNNNRWTIIDPLVGGKLIETLREEISEFESNVDIELSTSNATTFIEV